MTKTELFVVGYPKSGNTWLSRLLGDVLDSPVKARSPKHAIADEGFDRKGKYVIRQEHIDEKRYNGEEPIVLIVRDPRDVAVSAWKYWNRPSLVDTLHCMGNGRWPITHGGGWSSFYEFWLDKAVYVVSYEELIDNTASEMKWLMEDMELKAINRIEEAVKRQSFDERKKIAKLHGNDMPYGETVQKSLLRKGVVGDWKNHFDDECNQLAEKYFNDIAEAFGYYMEDYKNG